MYKFLGFMSAVSFITGLLMFIYGDAILSTRLSKVGVRVLAFSTWFIIILLIYGLFYYVMVPQ